MRHEEDHRFPGEGTHPIEPLDAHQAADFLRRRPPEQAALEEAAAEGAEMRPRELLARRLVHLRIAQAEVGQGNVAALAAEGVKQAAEGLAEQRQPLQRQEVQQPDQAEAEPGHHGGGSVPRGAL